MTKNKPVVEVKTPEHVKYRFEAYEQAGYLWAQVSVERLDAAHRPYWHEVKGDRGIEEALHSLVSAVAEGGALNGK